jgi:two-component system cell cycle response regulator
MADRPRLLVADASRMVRAAIAKPLSEAFTIREVSDGEAAWSALLTDPTIAAVVTGLAMDKIDGFELIQRVRASRVPRVRSLPVLVLASADAKDQMARATELGASGFVAKNAKAAETIAQLTGLVRGLGDATAVAAPDTPRPSALPSSQLVSIEVLREHTRRMASFAFRSETPLAVVVLRLRGAGPLLETALAANLASLLRAEDVAGKIDDDTYALTMMGADLAVIPSVVERVQAMLAEVALDRRQPPPVLLAGWVQASEPVDDDTLIESALGRLAPFDMGAHLELRSSRAPHPDEEPMLSAPARHEAAEISLDEAVNLLERGNIAELEVYRSSIAQRIAPLLSWLSEG